ncbi:MAG: DNA-directed RNA polymerase subunit L [Methanosphaera sp.]|jgi:DNA-directed RNA polymerase subunit L|uniref:DNA-directed RNA polymerase subunit L n=1 Tax=Methanosphaera TaxID=2316 RepID=UPI0023804176|nr:DNA-directed RNA polymerase subunit L [Candidatus Methanosphaera massiliense]MDD6285910.1 DNA-directed RNA polymerase subunit L [Methanobacteriaceae archaeon]MDE4077925.1 DNA-directed RNA polymerase subunit L [Candidatus Methanosphaera massiliense]MDY2745274.1 DNA-directed RNA polymerase subunit L [Methanosphaera sp.]
MKVIEEQPEKLVLEITGETHTICNILRKRLMSQDEVKAAAYDITHPLIGQPEFEVHSPNPRESIVTASEEIKKEAQDFKQVVEDNFQ